jgi:hypothetical protein
LQHTEYKADSPLQKERKKQPLELQNKQGSKEEGKKHFEIQYFIMNFALEYY